MIPKYRVWITYGYTEEDLKNPDMMDEIKETGLGFMGTPDLIDFRNDEIRVKYDCDWYDLDRFFLMQSTGLKDKNGREIFEGDVVHGVRYYNDQLIEIIGIVVQNYCELVIEDENKTHDPFLNYYDDFYGDQLSEVSVLGNIYENPELLSPKR